MVITKLNVSGFRNLAPLSVELDGGLNFFYGENASGKTSILESIYALAYGRSFRTSDHRSLVQNGESSFTVFLKGITGQEEQREDTSLALQRSIKASESFRLKIDGVDCHRLSVLASKLPLLCLAPDLILSSIQSRTQRLKNLDWGVFHVEHSFFQSWRGYQKILNQRNKLLKSRTKDQQELLVWDQQLASYGEVIKTARKNYIEELTPILLRKLALFFGDLDFSVSFKQGWSEQSDLLSALNESRERDLRFGITHIGSHRADVKFELNGLAVKECLSRGQQKLFEIAYKMSQVALFQQHKRRNCVVLIDDIASELDGKHLEIVINELTNFGSQILITSIEPIRELENITINSKMFHVKHGEICEE